jgi:hypothetical protein
MMANQTRVWLWLLAALGAAPAAAADKPFPLADKGYFTRSELDLLKFPPPVIDPDAAQGRLEKKSPQEIAYGTFLPQTKVPDGEPVPVYLIARLNADCRVHALWIDALHEFAGSEFGARIYLKDLKTGEYLKGKLEEGSRTVKPKTSLRAGDYYMTRADLRRLFRSLRPGRYEVSWGGPRQRSAPAVFEVTERKDLSARWQKELPTSRADFQILEVTNAQKSGPLFSWGKTDISGGDSWDITARLSRGIGGKYYPDVFDLPTADEHLSLHGEWSARDRRLKLTFAPRRDQTIELPDRPHIFLLVESDGLQRLRVMRDSNELLALPEEENLAPRTLEVTLPEDLDGLIDSGKVKFTVAVSSEDLSENRRHRLIAQIEREGVKRWAGVLRTQSFEVEVKRK